MTFTERLIVV